MNWFLSYLAVLVVPLLLCLLLYLYTANIITRESEKSFGSAVEQISIDLDAYLNEVEQVLEYILLDINVQRTTGITAAPDAYDQLKLMDAMVSLRAIQYNHPNLSGAFVALNDVDGLIGSGGYMSQAVFHSTQFGDALPLGEMQAILRQSYPTWTCVPVTKKDGSPALWFLRSTLNTAGGRNHATAVVCMDLSVFSDRLAGFLWDEEMGACILDGTGTVLCRAGAAFPTPEELPEGSQFLFRGSRGILTARSRLNDWRYVLCVSRQLILRNTHSVQVVAWLGMMVCILLGLLLSRYLTGLNYHPLGDLVQWMSSQEKTAAGEMRDKDEFERLNFYVQKYYRQRGDDQHALWNNRQVLRKYFVYSLLNQPKSDEATAEAVRANGLHLTAAWHIVVLLALPEPDGAEKLENNLTKELLQFAVLNIFGDLLSEGFELETTDVGGTCAAVVGMAEPSAERLAALEEDIRRTVQKVQEIFRCPIRAARGTPKEKLDGLYYSYAEALEALSYLQQFAGDEIIAYQDICDARQAYNFPLELEHRLIDLTQAGDGAGVAELVRKAFPATVRSPAVARSLAYDISSALVKGASQAGISNFSDIRLANCEGGTPEELQNYLAHIAALLCERVRAAKVEHNPNGRLCENVRRFIRENYSDPDLNISQTSLHFDMTPAYLSAVFKRETGQSLLDYIWIVRLDHVKEELGQATPLSRIAEQTGFRDSSALIRVFKKYTGTTPGQYRAEHFTAAP